jgi:hypothetical protein
MSPTQYRAHYYQKLIINLSKLWVVYFYETVFYGFEV